MPEDKSLPPHKKEEIPVYHAVVWMLGIVSILAIGGAISLSILAKPIPESVVALGAASVGALAGLLAPSPGK